MKIYDFSNCDFDNEILSDENTCVFLSKKFNYNGRQESRVIVSDEDKRLVFLINCGEVIEQTGYSDSEINSVMNYLVSIRENLLESIE